MMDTTMELVDLKQAWQSLDHQLQKQNALQLQQYRESKLRSLGNSLRPLLWGQLVQMAFGIGFVLLGAGIIAHVYGIATIIASGVMLGHIAKVDASLPVVEVQHRLLRMRKAYLISGMVVGLPWWVLWVVPLFVIAALQAMKTGGTAADLPMWLWLCLAGGMTGLIGTLAFHHWLHRPGREALARRMDDSAAGGSLRKAQAKLDELKRFMEE